MATTLDRPGDSFAPAPQADRQRARSGLTALDRALALGAALSAFVVYVRTLCPTISTGDCGEITTAVTTGGVMHPPGYPLYTMVGWVFVHAVPLGEPAWRLGLLSAICAAGAVALAYLLARRLGAARVWAFAGALALAFSYSLWEQATKVETYAPNAFLVALLLTLAAGFAESPTRRRFLTLAFCGGLSLTNHLTILWLIPAIFAISLPALYRLEGKKGFAKALALGAAACIAPLFLYGYEVIAAHAHPGGQVWNDPRTLERFYLQISGAQYHDYFTKMTAHEMAVRDFSFAPRYLWTNLGLWLPAAACGIVFLFRAGRKTIALGFLLGVGGYLVCNTIYGILNIYEYYTPVVVMGAVLGAVGADGITRTASERLWTASPLVSRALAAMLIGIAAAVPLRANAAFCDRSHTTYVRSYAENLLRPLPPNAVMVAQGDVPLFSLWYVQDVLGERRDVLIVPNILGSGFGTPIRNQLGYWFLEKVAHHDPSIPAAQILARCNTDKVFAAGGGPLWDVLQIEYSKGRAIYLSGSEQLSAVHGGLFEIVVPGAHSGPPLPPLYYITEGLSQQLVPKSRIPNLSAMLAQNLAVEKLTNFDTPDLSRVLPDTADIIKDDMTITKFYVDDLTYDGILLNSAHRYSEAYNRLARAHALNPWSARTDNAYAIACLMTGRRAEALANWQEALALAPANAIYRRNLDQATKDTRQGQ